MNDAKRRALHADQSVTLDFSAPDLVLTRGDRLGLVQSGDDDLIKEIGIIPEHLSIARAVRFTLYGVVNALQGFDRRDGRIWTAWVDILDEVDRGHLLVRVSWRDFEWLRRHVANEDLRVPPGIAQWREPIADYFGKLTPEESPKDENAT